MNIGPGELIGDLEMFKGIQKSVFVVKSISKNSEVIFTKREVFITKERSLKRFLTSSRN
jgi:hypothetical protein